MPQEVPLENFCLQSWPLLSSFHWLPVNPFHTIWFVNVNLLQVFFFRCRTYIQRLSLMKQALDIYFPQKTILLFATYKLYNKLNCLVLLVVYHLGSCVCFFFFLKFCWQSCVFNFKKNGRVSPWQSSVLPGWIISKVFPARRRLYDSFNKSWNITFAFHIIRVSIVWYVCHHRLQKYYCLNYSLVGCLMSIHICIKGTFSLKSFSFLVLYYFCHFV